jgi:hypothetical protein
VGEAQEALANAFDRLLGGDRGEYRFAVEDRDLGHRGATIPSLAVSPSNGKQSPRRPRIELAAAGPSATPEEAAAIAAAIEGFLRDTAPAPAPAGPAISPWIRAGRFEAAGLDPAGRSPWGDPEPWGQR